jgi:hypothetical protein
MPPIWIHFKARVIFLHITKKKKEPPPFEEEAFKKKYIPFYASG